MNNISKSQTNNTSANKNEKSLIDMLGTINGSTNTFANPNSTGGERAIALANMIASILA